MVPTSFKLLMFMTPGNSLGTWKKTGTIGRELTPYREYLKRGAQVALATFDRADEQLPEAAGFSLVFPPRSRLLFLLPWALRKAIRQADVLKTNQSGRSWWYVWAARMNGRPILLRCGYVAGEFIEITEGRSWRSWLYQLREGWAFRHADFCVVPTESLRRWVLARYGVRADRIAVLPNFIDTDVFQPRPGLAGAPRSVVAVGNMYRVKNMELLVKACARAGAARLTIYGDGPERPKVEACARALGLELRLPGRVANEDLPGALQAHSLYVQTSLWEGHPKSLLEAMACGMPCVGTRVPGTQDSIADGVTGLLCDPTEESCANAIRRLLDDPALGRTMGARAAATIRENFAFSTVFEKEYQLARRLADAAGARP